MALDACRQPSQAPVTLSYLRLGWSQPDELPSAERLSEQFTKETGIHLKNLPVPENTLDQLDLSRKLLQKGGPDPDVLGVDVIWAGALAGNLIDLRPSLGAEISSIEPQLAPSYTVDGKMVAIPYQIQIAVMEYRTDLLREYGYDHPPKTWDELENMAAKIQKGERAKGKKDFWGYVWQGANAEALTCNALEWQVAEGGGHVIESDRTISVNNPAAIRSWQRAKRWIGTISPPGVLAYRELDSLNVFDSGGAAFDRVWGGAPITRTVKSGPLHWRSTLAVTKTGYTNIPGGPAGWAATLGGSGLAVSRHSLHPREATELVRFLIRAQIQSERNGAANVDPQSEVRYHPSVTDPDSHSDDSTQLHRGIANRPSSPTGLKYEQVARAYIGAVHSVLAGQQHPAEAAAKLEKQLIDITGFRTGPPKKVD
jgi:trehalose/maltose transport system substrate-binding protein